MKILCAFGRYNYGDPTRGEGYEFTNFLPALRMLGHEVSLFDLWDKSAYLNYAALNREFLHRVDCEKPDIILSVLMSYELWSETLDIIRSNSSSIIINWGTDDSWKYEQFAQFVAPHLDCYATTYPEALLKSQKRGWNNFVQTQWAASRHLLSEPLPAKQCKHQVTFIGSAYGNRRKWIDDLSARGIPVECFGYGWPTGPVSTADLQRLYRESMLILNFGDSGLHLKGLLPYRSRQIKARVFEVPGAGGCLLTERAQHLDQYFRIGEEIVVFEGIDELADRIRYLLANLDARDAIAYQGFNRVRREHTYDKRFSLLFDSVKPKQASGPHVSMDWEGFESATSRHSLGTVLYAIRLILSALAQLFFGSRRGPRAARRLVFELSWRLAGSHTYSAAGLPGRMFYKDS